MLKASTITLLLSIILFYSANAQTVKLDFTTETGFSPKNITKTYENVMGTPYVDDEYQSVKISSHENKIYSGRFNAYVNEMEVLVGANPRPIALDISNNDYEVLFIVDNKLYKSFDYTTSNGIDKRGFLVVLQEENGIQVLKEEIVKYYDMVKASSSYDQDKPPKFRREDDNYYIALNSGKIVPLPTRSRDIIKAFPRKSKEISNFIKKNKIKTKREEDLIKLGSYIGTL